jgi:hypothetical protein
LTQGSRRHIAAIIGAALMAASAGAAESAPGVAAAPEAAGPGYEFGRGLHLGDSGFTLGGYATAEYRQPKGEAGQLKSSHASAFVWWEGLQVVKAFAELDLLNATENPRGDADDADRRVSLERLYVDLAASDAIMLRAGKFLTPIGRWNAVHADPLVWTTTAPLLARSRFPHNLTGLMASGQQPALVWSVYGANGNEWRRDRWEDSFSKVVGGRAVWSTFADLQLGVSAARYEQARSRGVRRRLVGLDLFWARKGWELSAEWLRSTADKPELLPEPYEPEPGDTQDDEDRFGAPSLATRTSFVQGVAPLGRNWYAVARLEWSRDPGFGTLVRQQVAGLAWRPSPGLSLKLERWHLGLDRPGSSSGLVASTSVLF